MNTTITIYRPGAEAETRAVELGGQPGNRELRELLTPLLDGARYEHVSVLHDERRADMFVDEDGHGKGLERNEAATAIYRANTLAHAPGTDPESLPWIAGTAILFSRRVWF